MSTVARAAILVATVVATVGLAPAPPAPDAGPCGSDVVRVGTTEQPVAGSLPVLFVHGITSDAEFWKAGLVDAVTAVPTTSAWTFDYRDVSVEWVDHPEIGPALAQAITCLARATGRNPIVVNHSMGGLATQYAVSQDIDGRPVADLVAGVVTIGTPFEGSALLDLAQRGRGLGRLSPALLSTVAADALLSICAARETCGPGRALETPVGEALREGSAEIDELPDWPKDLPVLPIAGDIQAVLIGVDLGRFHDWLDDIKKFAFYTQSLGDPVVSVESGTAHAVGGEPVVVRCPRSTLTQLLSTPCFHSNLPEHPDVRDAVVEVVSDIQQADVGTVYYAEYRYDRTSGGSAVLHAAPAGSRARPVVDLHDKIVPAVSPDGRQLSWVDGNIQTARLMVSDINGTNARPLADVVIDFDFCNTPVWSPDSDRILFQQESPSFTSPGRWATVDVTTGALTRLEPTGCYPVWSPDGGSIAWFESSPTGGSSSIRITDATGQGDRFVPLIEGVPDPCGNVAVALSPGARFALVSASQLDQVCGDGPGGRSVGAGLVVDTATGKAVPVPVGLLGSGTYLPDGRLFAQPADGSPFALLDPQLNVLARVGPSGEGRVVLAFVPHLR